MVLVVFLFLRRLAYLSAALLSVTTLNIILMYLGCFFSLSE